MNRTFRTILFVFCGVLVAAVIVLGAIYIDNANKTISNLSDQLADANTPPVPDSTQTPIPTQTPKQTNIEAETNIIELEGLYNQKEVLLEGYRQNSKSIKGLYLENEDFGEVYAFLIKLEWKYVKNSYTKYDEIKQTLGLNADANTYKAACQCALFDTYVQENELVLIEAKTKIEQLKALYSTKDYDKAKGLLKSIDGLQL